MSATGCRRIARIVAASNAHGKATYVITPLRKGWCAATFSGGGKRAKLTLAVEMGLVHVSIVIPPKLRGGARRPAFVSPNSQSLGVSVDGGAVQPIGLTPATNPDCTGDGDTTPIVCTGLAIAAPPGSDTFTLDLYEQALAGGQIPIGATLLSQYTTPTPLTIAVGVANELGTFTMNPIVGSLSLQVGAPAGGYAAGSAASGIAVTVTAKDPSGATILSPGKYLDAGGDAAPIVISTSQSAAPFSSAFSFSVDGGNVGSTGSLNGPGDSVTLDYSGLTVGATTFTAKSGTTSAIATAPPIQGAATLAASCAESNIDTCSGGTTADAGSIAFTELGDTATLTPSEPGWTPSPYSQLFTLQSDTCNLTDDASATGNWASVSPAAGNTATSFTVTAQNAGSDATPAICTVTLADGTGQTLTVDVSVTTSGFGVDFRHARIH